MHLDIWSPENVLHEYEDGGHILNCMCDLTQFIVSCILIDTRSEALSKMFMEQVILIFDMVVVVVVDANCRFRTTFAAMCKLLKLTFWSLARGNHKGNSVDHMIDFLTKLKLSVDRIKERMRCSIRILKRHSTHGIARQLTTHISYAVWLLLDKNLDFR